MSHIEHFKDIFITVCWVGVLVFFTSKIKDVKELVLAVFDRLKNGSIKADMNNKSFEVNLVSETSKIDKIDIKKEIIELKGLTEESMVNRYSKLEYDKSIFALSEFKDSMIILKETTAKVKEELQLMIAKNHILSKTHKEYKKYIEKNIEQIIKKYDNAFYNSSIDFIHKLSIQSITGSFLNIIKHLIDKMFWDIYTNHETENTKKEFDFKQYDRDFANQKITQSKLIFYKLQRSITFESEVRINDNYIVNNGINILELVLVGLVHDKIKYNIVNKK